MASATNFGLAILIRLKATAEIRLGDLHLVLIISWWIVDAYLDGVQILERARDSEVHG